MKAIQPTCWSDDDGSDGSNGLSFDDFEKLATIETKKKLLKIEDELYKMEEGAIEGKEEDDDSKVTQAKPEIEQDFPFWDDWQSFRRQKEEEDVPDIDNFQRKFIYLRIEGKRAKLWGPEERKEAKATCAIMDSSNKNLHSPNEEEEDLDESEIVFAFHEDGETCHAQERIGMNDRENELVERAAHHLWKDVIQQLFESFESRTHQQK
mmetsp:Transcript_20925/g.27517  ORF Transcript_20925/g.27517 Transcript_20925/m.27517 type:complete len:208 (-) Transcript_20925:69-692(-)